MDENCSDSKIQNNKKSFSPAKHETSIAKSIRTSVKRVSNLYEQTSRIYSRIGDFSQNEIEEKPDIEKDKNLSKSLIEPGHTYVDSKKSLSGDFADKLKNEEGSSFIATLFVYIKVNIVAGFLFLPNGFLLGGWLFSLIAIILVSLIVAYCNVSLAECTDEVKSYSFTVIGYKSLGIYGKYLVEYGIAISQICFPCSYANLIATVLAKLFQIWFGIDGEKYYWYYGIGLLVILIPLCFLRKISAFNQLHLIGDIAVLATVIALLVNSINIISNNFNFNISDYKMIDSGWSKILGMAVTTLEGVGVILPIKESMKEKKDFNKVVYIGMFIVVLILIGFPLVAFFSYGKNTPEIVLTVLPFDKIYIQVVMVLMVFSIIVVYPVQLNPAFKIFEQSIIKCVNHKTIFENILRTTVLLLTVVIGIASIDKFANLMALAGCAVCTPIALIFPTIFHYKIFKGKQSCFRSICDISISLLGIGLSLTILVFTFLDW